MSATLNVVPCGDLYPHVEDATCPCGPRLGPFYDEDEGVTWKAIVHNSWDRREEAEREHATWPYAFREAEA